MEHNATSPLGEDESKKMGESLGNTQGEKEITGMEDTVTALFAAAESTDYYRRNALRHLLGVDGGIPAPLSLEQIRMMEEKGLVVQDAFRSEQRQIKRIPLPRTDDKKQLNKDLVEMLRRLQLHATFAAVSDKGVNMVRIPDGKGGYLAWGQFSLAGLWFKNSDKLHKRLRTITRDSFIWDGFEVDQLIIDVVTVQNMTKYTTFDDGKVLDGANVISRDLYIALVEISLEREGMMHFDEEMNKVFTDRGKEVWKRAMRSKTGQFRLIYPDGNIKGDYIVGHKKNFVDCHIRVFEENIKHDMGWNGGIFLQLEPHPDKHSLVYMDNQTDSWLGRHFMPLETRVQALHDLNRKVLNGIRRGEVPDYLRNWNPITSAKDLKQNPDDDDEGVDTQIPKSISNTQIATAKWIQAGHDLRDSSWMINQLGGGHLNMLAPRQGRNINRVRWPIPNAMRAHVATDAWLRMAGYHYPSTNRGAIWYCEAVQRAIYHDADFLSLYERHGGWDLDDTIVMVDRTLRSNRRIWIVYRQPNGYGEYAIMNHNSDSDYRPIWKKADGKEWGDIKVVLKNLPLFLEDVPQLNNFTDLPSANKAETPYLPQSVMNYVQRMITGGNIGQWSNFQMIWYWANDCPRPSQLIPTEFAADTYMADRDPERIELADKDLALVKEQLKDGNPIEYNLWEARAGRLEFDGYTAASEPGDYTKFMEAYQEEVKAFSEELSEMARELPKRLDGIVTKFVEDQCNAQHRAIATYIWQQHYVPLISYFSPLRQSEGLRGPTTEDWTWMNKSVSNQFAKLPPNMRIRALAQFYHTYVIERNHQNDTTMFMYRRENDNNILEDWAKAFQMIKWVTFGKDLFPNPSADE